MATLFQTAFLIKCLVQKLLFILSKFIPKCPSTIKSKLVQVMALRRKGDKSLSEPMMTKFIDANMCGLKTSNKDSFRHW